MENQIQWSQTESTQHFGLDLHTEKGPGWWKAWSMPGVVQLQQVLSQRCNTESYSRATLFRAANKLTSSLPWKHTKCEFFDICLHSFSQLLFSTLQLPTEPPSTCEDSDYWGQTGNVSHRQSGAQMQLRQQRSQLTAGAAIERNCIYVQLLYTAWYQNSCEIPTAMRKIGLFHIWHQQGFCVFNRESHLKTFIKLSESQVAVLETMPVHCCCY